MIVFIRWGLFKSTKLPQSAGGKAGPALAIQTFASLMDSVGFTAFFVFRYFGKKRFLKVRNLWTTLGSKLARLEAKDMTKKYHKIFEKRVAQETKMMQWFWITFLCFMHATIMWLHFTSCTGGCNRSTQLFWMVLENVCYIRTITTIETSIQVNMMVLTAAVKQYNLLLAEFIQKRRPISSTTLGSQGVYCTFKFTNNLIDEN